MVYGRGSPIPELMMLKSSQDQSQDANSALWELEKGIKLPECSQVGSCHRPIDLQQQQQ